jgi:hypothetical protein
MPLEPYTTKEVRAFFEGPHWDKTKSVALQLALAGLGAGAGVSLLGELARRLKRPTDDMPAPDEMGDISLSLPQSLKGRRLKHGSHKEADGTKNWLEHPAAMPAVGLSSLGGLLGGYYGSEWLMEKLRKKETDDELEAARREFEDAIQASFTKRKKAASAPEQCGAEIDELYDMYKEAEGPSTWDWVENKAKGVQDATRLWEGGPSLAAPGFWGGTALAGGGLLWALIHNMSKKHFEKEDPERLKLKALEQLQRMRYATSPPSITFESM